MCQRFEAKTPNVRVWGKERFIGQKGAEMMADLMVPQVHLV